jgi:lysophospholipase L1-like esterase
MSIQTADGDIHFDSSDWQQQYSGVLFGIKIRYIPLAYITVAILCEQDGYGKWNVVENIDMGMESVGNVDLWMASALSVLNKYTVSRFNKQLDFTLKPSKAYPENTIIESIDKNIVSCITLKATSITDKSFNISRIAILGDSISSRNNGASATSWPELMDSMIKSLGVFDIQVRNYSQPGLTYKTAVTPTQGFMVGGKLSPVEAIKSDGCDLVIICMGVNDRYNIDALADAEALKQSLPFAQVIMMQNMVGENSIVTEENQQAMLNSYAPFSDGFLVNIGKLYSMGFTYDGLHPTNTGKQWMASACYMYIQQYMPITPIGRNIGWLYNEKQSNPLGYSQMLKVNT